MLTDEQIRAKALYFAKNSGDSQPSEILFVRTSADAAMAAVHGAVTSDSSTSESPNPRRVVLIVMKGSFSLDAPRPRRAKRPSGNTAYVVYDELTGAPVSLGVGDRIDPISLAGKPTRIELD